MWVPSDLIKNKLYSDEINVQLVNFLQQIRPGYSTILYHMKNFFDIRWL
jgi:hypothetical protein